MANNGQSSIFNFFIQCYPERVSEPFNSYIFLPFCNHSYRRLLYFRQNTGLGHFHTCLIFPTWKLHPNFSLSVGTAICWNLGPLLWIFLLEKPRLALKKNMHSLYPMLYNIMLDQDNTNVKYSLFTF